MNGWPAGLRTILDAPGAFVAALVSIPLAGALQVIVRELWEATR